MFFQTSSFILTFFMFVANGWYHTYTYIFQTRGQWENTHMFIINFIYFDLHDIKLVSRQFDILNVHKIELNYYHSIVMF